MLSRSHQVVQCWKVLRMFALVFAVLDRLAMLTAERIQWSRSDSCEDGRVSKVEAVDTEFGNGTESQSQRDVGGETHRPP